MKYRRLKKGEIILPNDEIQEDNETWTKTTCSGQQSPDPQYTCHRQYRRKNSVARRIYELLVLSVYRRIRTWYTHYSQRITLTK